MLPVAEQSAPDWSFVSHDTHAAATLQSNAPSDCMGNSLEAGTSAARNHVCLGGLLERGRSAAGECSLPCCLPGRAALMRYDRSMVYPGLKVGSLTWLVPRHCARFSVVEMSARNSCAPVFCSAEPTPVRHRAASSCPKSAARPQPIMPAPGSTACLQLPGRRRTHDGNDVSA